jgi:acetate kinase
MERDNLSASEINNIMNKKSGFLGVAGLSDSRDLEDAILEGPSNPNYEKALLAVNILKHQLKKYIGSYAAVMNGLDAVVFTAGIGENSTMLRKMVCEDMHLFGIEIDEEANLSAFRKSDPTKISKDGSKVTVYVIPTNEELVIARDTAAIVAGK